MLRLQHISYVLNADRPIVHQLVTPRYKHIHCVSKNDTDVAYYNFNAH